MIEVVNRKYFTGDGIYIGRAMKGIPGSPLGNPYKVKPHGRYERDETVHLYRRRLWQEIKRGAGPAFEELRRLGELAQRGDLRLICWCKQPGANIACHGDVIRDAIEWMLAQGADKPEGDARASAATGTHLPTKMSAKSEIIYVCGDATRPQGGGVRIIAHCVNNQGFWGKGFVLALSGRWAAPEHEYRRWHRNGGQPFLPFELGQVQLVGVAHHLFVANLIGQAGIRRNREGLPPVRYEALRQGFVRIAEHATWLHASVHMPRIGAGLAGGDWGVIAGIIEDELCARGINVTIYDLNRDLRE